MLDPFLGSTTGIVHFRYESELGRRQHEKERQRDSSRTSDGSSWVAQVGVSENVARVRGKERSEVVAFDSTPVTHCYFEEEEDAKIGEIRFDKHTFFSVTDARHCSGPT